LVAIGAVVWFTTASWRADKAQQYDARSRNLLGQHDIGGSYQQARLAYAISSEPDRALSLGALAYLRGDFQRSLDFFSKAQGSFGALGRAAAGAHVDPEAYRTARGELGNPNDTVIRLGLSHAAIDAADFPTAARLSRGARTIVGAYPLILAESIDDPDQAARTMDSLQTGTPEVIHPDRTVAAFLNKLVEVSPDARENIAGSLRNMALSKGTLSRRVMRGSLLLDLGERSAAAKIGRNASEQQPDYRDAWNLRAAADLSLGNYDDADRAIGVSVDLDPGFGYSWYLKSELEKARDNQRKSDEYLRRAKLLGFGK
jgi:tetratricopeptide (TPR) repeat protein